MNSNVKAITCVYDIMIWYEHFKYLSKLMDWKIIKKKNLPRLVSRDSAVDMWRKYIHVPTLRGFLLQKPLQTTDTGTGTPAHVYCPI